jgi:hypothetical protein
MLQMYVAGIGLEQSTGQPVVLLGDSEKRKALPILIGVAEAKAISKALQNSRSKRPSTHELLAGVVDSFGYELDHVEIQNGTDDTYFAKIALVSAQGANTGPVVEIDSRPSDAIVLALMQEAPIMVAEQLVKATIEVESDQDAEAQTQKFKEFVSQIKASDFNKFGKGPAELPE